MVNSSPFLAPLACWVLAISLIQEERLIGDEQYWLTRPYSWKELAAAKLVFLVVFVNLPLFVCQFAALANTGLSPLEWLSALLWRQVFFSIFFIAPAVASATVTRHLGQVVLVAIATFVLIEAGIPVLIGSRYPDWGGLNWIGTCLAAVTLAVGMSAAILLQYARRRASLARGIVAGTIALALVPAYAPVWGGAFAIQKLFARQAIADSTVRMSFDESRAGTRPTQDERSGNDPDGVRLEIPLRVDDVPPASPLAGDLASVGIEGPAGAWRSGWLSFHAFHQLSQGKAWLTVYVDPGYYQRNQDAPVRLWGALALTLYRPAGTFALRREGVTAIPGVGLCVRWPGYVGGPRGQGQYRADCYSPFQRFVLAQSDQADAWFPGESYAPFPTSPGFQPFDLTTSWTVTEPIATVALRLPVAHVERRFEIRSLRLATYRVH